MLFAARRDPLCPVGGIEGVVHLDERLVPLVGVLVGTDLDGASFSVRERCGGVENSLATASGYPRSLI